MKIPKENCFFLSGSYGNLRGDFFLCSIVAPPLDSTEKKGLQLGIQLPASVHSGLQQQNQFLLTPASLQLAQLQAQLTLQRLKLAQGGSATTAASVLNQFLSNVNMSQPLLNQLRTSAMVGNPQGAFPTGVMGFPTSNSAMGALVGGGFNQNPGNVGLNHPSGVGTKVQQGGKSGSTYPSDTDRRLQYNLAGGTSVDGQYTTNMNNTGFQRDVYGPDVSGQPSGFTSNEQMSVRNTTGHKEQWQGHTNLSQTGNVDMVTNPPTAWTKTVQPMWSRTEVYNPEEPTSEPKSNCNVGNPSFGSSGTQGFESYQPLHGNEETLSSGTRTLQPYQVNDYYGVTPDQLPHQCSICDKKVYNLKVSELNKNNNTVNT